MSDDLREAIRLTRGALKEWIDERTHSMEPTTPEERAVHRIAIRVHCASQDVLAAAERCAEAEAGRNRLRAAATDLLTWLRGEGAIADRELEALASAVEEVVR